jgi:DNA modification methylase
MGEIILSLTIYIKDSCINMNEIANNSIDLVLTSPPYWMLRNYENQNQIGLGMTYKQFIYYLKNNIIECIRVLKEDALAVFIVGDIRPKAGYGGKEEDSRCKTYSLQAKIINIFEEFDCDLFSHIIWSKTSNKSNKKIYGNVDKEFVYPPYIHMDLSNEHILVFRKPGNRRNIPSREIYKFNGDIIDKKSEAITWLKPVWFIEPVNSNTTNHPAPFPSELVERLIRLFSLKGDTILDPFCGSGTTLKVAFKLGRTAIGYEINSDYLSDIILNNNLNKYILDDKGNYCYKSNQNWYWNLL